MTLRTKEIMLAWDMEGEAIEFTPEMAIAGLLKRPEKDQESLINNYI